MGRSGLGGGAAAGLVALGVELARPFVELGVLARRGLQVSVVWMAKPVPSLEELCLGLRRRLGRDALIVVTPARPRLAFPAAERIVFHEMPAGCGGTEINWPEPTKPL